MHCSERIHSPFLAVGISAASRAGRGCECCIGRSRSVEGVARIWSNCDQRWEETHGKEKTSPALSWKEQQNFRNWQPLDVLFLFPSRTGGQSCWKDKTRTDLDEALTWRRPSLPALLGVFSLFFSVLIYILGWWCLLVIAGTKIPSKNHFLKLFWDTYSLNFQNTKVWRDDL